MSVVCQVVDKISAILCTEVSKDTKTTKHGRSGEKMESII